MKISIATPTFGKPEYLKESVQSVCNQTLKTKHIVCAGSYCGENLDRYEPQVVRMDPDPGMVPCWSKAACLADTQYVGFLADDNTFHPEYADKMVHFLENHPECDLVFCNQFFMNGDGSIDDAQTRAFTKLFGRDELPAGSIAESFYNGMLEKGSVPLEACVIRKTTWNKYGPFRIEAKGSFDHEFINRLLLNNVKVGFIPEYLMNFRIHDGAYSTRQKKEHIKGSIWTYEELLKISGEYYQIFKSKSVFYKARLLRYNIPVGERIGIMVTLCSETGGIYPMIKNSVVRFLNIAGLWKN